MSGIHEDLAIIDIIFKGGKEEREYNVIKYELTDRFLKLKFIDYTDEIIKKVYNVDSIEQVFIKGDEDDEKFFSIK